MEEVEGRVEGETIRQPSQFNKNLDQGENGHQKRKQYEGITIMKQSACGTGTRCSPGDNR